MDVWEAIDCCGCVGIYPFDGPDCGCFDPTFSAALGSPENTRSTARKGPSDGLTLNGWGNIPPGKWGAQKGTQGLTGYSLKTASFV